MARKCHRPRTSSCHDEQLGGTEYGLSSALLATVLVVSGAEDAQLLDPTMVKNTLPTQHTSIKATANPAECIGQKHSASNKLVDVKGHQTPNSEDRTRSSIDH